jgi:sortase A
MIERFPIFFRRRAMREDSNAEPAPPKAEQRMSERWLVVLGNLLMIMGCYLLVYVGGLYADAAYNRWAARGDTDVAPPPPVARRADDEPAAFVVPATFTAPVLAVDGQQPVATENGLTPQPALVSRVVIPSIGVDSKVVEVGWDVVDGPDGQPLAVWQVAEYAVGQHKGSANPGQGSNVVLAGHVGGYGKVFKDLFYLEVGDPIIVYSNGTQYRYQVSEKLVVDEEGAPPEQQAANARYIEPTEQEVVTLLTCWPDSGPNRFAQRIIVRATPFATPTDLATTVSNWTVR